jgi:hypothetical protein
VYVHVARPLTENVEQGEVIQAEDLEEIAWAELYESEGDALSAMPSP